MADRFDEVFGPQPSVGQQFEDLFGPVPQNDFEPGKEAFRGAVEDPVEAFRDEEQSQELARIRRNEAITEPEPEADSWGTVGRKFVENLDESLVKLPAGGLLQAIPQMLGEAASGVAAPVVGLSLSQQISEVVGEFAGQAARPLTEFGEELAGEARAELERNRPEFGPDGENTAKRYAYDIANGFVQMGSAFAATLATRSPTVGASLMGAQVFGEQFDDSLRKGRTQKQAIMDAAFMGTAELVSERIPLKVLMESGGTFGKRVFKGAAAEGIQEMVTEALQTGYDAGILDEEMTFGEAVRAVVDAGIIGSAAGGGIAAVSHPFMREPDPGKVQEGLDLGMSPEVAADYARATDAPMGIRESGALSPDITPEDEASPLPTDKIVQGKMTMGAATATGEANQALRSAGMPDVGSRVTVSRDGKSQSGAVADAWTVDIAGQTSVGIKIRLDDGTMIEEPVDTLADMGVTIAAERLPEGLPETDLADPVIQQFASEGMRTVEAAQSAVAPSPVSDATDAPITDPASSGAASGGLPVQGRITSPFGARKAPKAGASTNHGGVDIAAPIGTPVRPVAGGVVLNVGNHGVRGKWVEIDHGGGLTSRYFHLDSYDVKPGDRIGAGQVIAKTGATGNVTGPHLHYSVLQNGQPVDPQGVRFEGSMGKPIDRSGAGVQTDLFGGEEVSGTQADARRRVDEAEQNEDFDRDDAVAAAEDYLLNQDDPAYARHTAATLGSMLDANITPEEAPDYANEVLRRFRPAPIEGERIDKEWVRFADDSGSLGIPRDQMPQIKAEHRGAMVNFLNARGIRHEEATVPATALMPTQTEFSPAKVEKAKKFTGGDRAILVSEEGNVVDGHHQWLAKREAGESIRAIVLKAPIQRVLDELKEMPSVETAGGGAPSATEAEPGRFVARGITAELWSRLTAGRLTNADIERSPLPTWAIEQAVSARVAGEVNSEDEFHAFIQERMGAAPSRTEAVAQGIRDQVDAAGFGGKVEVVPVTAPKQAAMKAKMAGKKGETRLARYSIDEPITGYDTTGEGASGPRKKAFLDDGRRYLKAVASILELEGFQGGVNRKGKPEAPVRINEGGPAVSGEVMLSMFKPGGNGVYVQISQSGVTGAGIDIMYRGAQRTKDPYGTRHTNNWQRPDLTAAELAEKLKALANEVEDEGGATEPARTDSQADGPTFRWIRNLREDLSSDELESVGRRLNQSRKENENDAAFAERIARSNPGEALRDAYTATIKARRKAEPPKQAAMKEKMRAKQDVSDNETFGITNPSTPEGFEAWEAAQEAIASVVDERALREGRILVPDADEKTIDELANVALAGRDVEAAARKMLGSGRIGLVDQGTPERGEVKALPKSSVVPAPAKTVRAQDYAGPFISPQEAAERLAEWKAEAKRIGETNRDGQIILSLFDASGAMAQPWRDMGYEVYQLDIKHGYDLLRNMPDVLEVVRDFVKGGANIAGVIAQPPCTTFAGSGARWWKERHNRNWHNAVRRMWGDWAAKEFDSPLEYNQALVMATETIIGESDPDMFVIENPVGRIEKMTGLPKPRLVIQPHHFGAPYTKRTNLWGKFDPVLPTANVDPVEGSKIAEKLRSTDEKGSGLRSLTPEGFAYAFALAQHEALEKLRPTSDSQIQSDAATDNNRPDARKSDTDSSQIRASGYGASNKVFTAETAEAARALIRSKLNQLNSGFDPELLAAGMQLAGFHIEAGARKFAALAKAIADDLGAEVAKLKPYLAAWYNGARDTLEGQGDDISDMDGPGAVRAALSMIADSGIGDGDANSGTSLERPEGQGPAAVQPAEPGREAGRVGEGPARTGERDLRAPDRGSGEAAERGGEGPGAASSSRGASDRGGDGRPDGRGSASASGQNYVIRPGALDEARGPKQKARDNVEAIRVVKRLASENRFATPEEQDIIARYVGWGGLKNVFPDARGNMDRAFADVGAELRELLSDSEYDTARRSIQYAHYTAEKVVREMWRAVQHLGFNGGTVLEPGMGTGNFPGMAPEGLAFQYQGVEFDGITYQIAKALYPKHGVTQADFTGLEVARDAYRLAIGNPPFSETTVKADPAYRSLNLVLHDYFFAKSLDALQPGGLLAFVTSAGTMNKLDATARRYLAERAWLAGAVRLPGDAFKQNAGTEVTTDIIFLRKKVEGEERPAWAVDPDHWTALDTATLKNKQGEKVRIQRNLYFTKHPEMVLGEEGLFDKLFPNRYGVRSDGRDLAKALAEAVDRLPADVLGAPTAAAQARAVTADFDVAEAKNGSYYLKDGKLYQKRGGVGVEVETKGKGSKSGLNEKDQAVVRDLIPIRDRLREVYAHDLAVAEGRGSAAEAETARKALNKAYDAFTKKHGPINKGVFSHRRPNRVAIEGARRRAREEARAQGHEWDDGSLDIASLYDEGATVADVARIRAEMREEHARAGQAWSDGSFADDEVPDVIIEKRPNIDPFREDPENYRLRSIEHYDDETGTAKKGRVFFESVIAREEEPDIRSATDAMFHVLNRHGRVDLDAIAQLAGSSPADAAADLAGQIFHNPETREWQHSTVYLAGNVRQKLDAARKAVRGDRRYQANVDALEAVMPPDLGKSEVSAALGMPWIPPEDVNAFVAEELGLASFAASYQPRLATWAVSGDKHSAAATSTWGTARRNATELMSDALNGQSPKIYDTWRDQDGEHRVFNAQETQAAQDKLNQIKERFGEWIWKDEARTGRLLKLYNERFNSHVAPEWDGSYLTTPGVTASWKWRPHQKRAIARIVQAGNTYLGHAVGAGKTASVIAAAMEMKRLGLVNKPMVVVPNHMLGQFTKEWYELYPLARLMVADEANFHTDKRKQFVSDVALNDLDGVVITHSAFGLIPMSPQFEARFLREQVSELRSILAEIDPKEDRITRRQVEQQIEQLEQRIRGITTRRRDQTFTFEQLGVDFVFVDEAHMFRKLDFATRRGQIKGIDPNGSMRSMDLFIKTRYLEERRPGRSHVLMSGTPITNTMGELFTISRFLQPAELRSRGVDRFDAWASAYGDTETALEPTAGGTYKPQTRFARFVNVPELSVMVRQIMDVVTSSQLEDYVVRPKVRRELILTPQTPGQRAYQDVLNRRMEIIERRTGRPEKGDDIILTVIGDGRKSSIDMRLVDAAADKESTKLERLIENVHQVWKETKKHPFYEIRPEGYSEQPVTHGPAAQMIFSSLGVSEAMEFNVHRYIRGELIKRGVPASEIVLFNTMKTTVQKQKVFNDTNAGKVRILIGSVDKMGTGVNAQKRLYANHNLDPEWLPSSDEQRNGRIIRQGNTNREIRIFDYATKGTYDEQMWGIMARKARFIEGFFRGDPTLRVIEDLGEASTYEQAKALVAKDPRILELAQAQQELEKELRRRNAHDSEQATALRKSIGFKANREAEEARLVLEQQDAGKIEDIKGDAFKATLDGKEFDDRQEFQAALDKAMEADSLKRGLNRSGKIGGLELAVLVSEAERFGFDSEDGTAQMMRVVEPVLVLANDPQAIEARYVELSRKNTAVSAQAALEKIRRRPEDTRLRIAQLRKSEAEFAARAANVEPYSGLPRIREIEETVERITSALKRENEAREAAKQGQQQPKGQARRRTVEVTLRKRDVDAIRTRLLQRLAELGIEDRITLEVGYGLQMGGPGWQGQFEPWWNVIKVALDRSRDAEHTLNHETVHALGPSGLSLITAAEWAVLSEAAWADARLRKWVETEPSYAGIPLAEQQEEAAAEFVADTVDFMRGRANGGAPLTPAQAVLARVASRIGKFLNALRHAVSYLVTGKPAGLRAIDVILKIDSGEVGRRFGKVRGRTPVVRFGRKGQAGAVPARNAGLPAGETPLSAFSNTRHVQTALKAHADYAAAKAGDTAAAIRLVRDLVPAEMLLEARKRFAGATFVPVVAEEASGRNKIPIALAAELAVAAGGDIDTSIVQSNRAYHTGAGAMDRMVARPLFDGEVEKGQRYVVVDDVTVMGATLAELSNHLAAGGGEVVGTALLVNASRNPVLGTNKLRSKAVERRFGDVVRQELGIEPEALTSPESAYLLNFRGADSLRARIAKARSERVGRLGARGVQAEPAPVDRGSALSDYIEARDLVEGDLDLETDDPDLEDGHDAEDPRLDIRGQAAPPPPAAGGLFAPGIEERWQESAKGIGDGPAMTTRLNLAAGRIGQAFTRHWIDLPNEPKYAALQQELRKLEAAPQSAKERAVRHLSKVLEGLTREDMDLFTRKVVTDDLAWEADQDHQLPFGFTPETLSEARQAIEQELAGKPHIVEAVRRRKALNRTIAQELVAAGVLDAERLKNPNYYRHVVLDYARAEAAAARAPGQKKKLRSPRWARRLGSERDINANYLEAEFDWLAKALVDIPTARAISWIGDSSHNILPALREQAKRHNKAGIEALIEKEAKPDFDGQPVVTVMEQQFRQRIAMGFKFVEDALATSHLDIPPQLQRSFEALGTNRGDPFPFLSWLLDNNHPGANGAAAILKAISQRRVFEAKVLGRGYIDPTDAEMLVKKLAPEGYATWSPDDARLLFTVKTMPEHAIDAMLEKIDSAPGVSGDDVRAMLESVRSALSFGGMRYAMVLPEEVASTLNRLRREDFGGIFDTLAERPVRVWKVWQLINPRRWFKYNLNNQTGDLDAVIAGRGIFNGLYWRYVGKAAVELAQVMRGTAEPSARYEEAVERGVFDSGISVQEIPDIQALSAFENLTEGVSLRPDKVGLALIRKAWGVLRGTTQWRENVFRYAAYLELAHRLEAGEGMDKVGYAASLPKMVDAVPDLRDRAALLAREMIGDYGAISYAGAEIRRKVIPFWSWMEINTKRYWRLSSNAFAQGTAKGLATGGLLGAGLAVRTTAWLGVRMFVFFALVQLWNHLRFPDEEDDLSEEQKRQLHLIIGRDGEGRVLTLRAQGALSDAISWFGLGDASAALRDYELGRGPWWDVALAPPKATINKLTTSLTPVLTIPAEAATGKKLWPDIFATRFIRDRWRNLFSAWSLENEYDLLLGKPSRGYEQSWINAFIYSRDPGETSYNEARGLAYDWLKRTKGQDGGVFSSHRSDALYAWRAARRFGDRAGEEKALDRMIDLGVTDKDLEQSIKRAHPLGPIAKKDRKAFLDQLTDEELETFEEAETFYRQRFLEGPAL